MSFTISGKITNDADGSVTEFLLSPDHGSYMQWGGTREQLAARCDYLEAMVDGLAAGTGYFGQAEDEEEEDQ
jgi:hypothetical protein